MAIALAARPALLAAGIGSFIVIGAAQALYGPALPIYLRHYRLDTAGAGWLVSAHWLGSLSAVLAMLFGFGFRARHALGLIAAGAAVLAAEGPWPAMLAGAALIGLGYGATGVIFNRRFLLEFGPRGPAMVGVVNAIFALGAIGAPLVLVALGNAPRLAFALVALIALVVLPVARPGAEPAAARPARMPLRPHPVLLLGIACVGCEASLTGLGPAGLVARGLGEAAAAQLTSAFFLAFLLGRASLYWIAGRVPPFRLMWLAMLGLGLAMLAAALMSPGLPYAAAGYFIGILFPSYFVCASARVGSDARASSLIFVSCQIGGILMPGLLGLALARPGAGAVFPLMAGIAAVIAAGMLPFLRRMR